METAAGRRRSTRGPAAPAAEGKIEQLDERALDAGRNGLVMARVGPARSVQPGGAVDLREVDGVPSARGKLLQILELRAPVGWWRLRPLSAPTGKNDQLSALLDDHRQCQGTRQTAGERARMLSGPRTAKTVQAVRVQPPLHNASQASANGNPRGSVTANSRQLSASGGSPNLQTTVRTTIPTVCDPVRRERPRIDRPRGRPYDGRPGGLRTGSPPSPPPRSIRPTVRRLPRSPRLSGPGPHSGRSVSCPAAPDRPVVRRRAPNLCYSAASAIGAIASQIVRNSSRRFR